MLKAEPIELKEANAFVSELHRHHDPVYRDKFRVAAVCDGKIVGVCAKCGEPLDNETTWCNFCRIKQAEATRRYEGRLRDAQG